VQSTTCRQLRRPALAGDYDSSQPLQLDGEKSKSKTPTATTIKRQSMLAPCVDRVWGRSKQQKHTRWKVGIEWASQSHAHSIQTLGQLSLRQLLPIGVAGCRCVQVRTSRTVPAQVEHGLVTGGRAVLCSVRPAQKSERAHKGAYSSQSAEVCQNRSTA
jgi:hypothetical protein